MGDDNTGKEGADLLVVLNHAPHGSAWVREGLEVALVAATLGQRVSVLLTGEGVWAAVKQQHSGALSQKGTHTTLEALSMYDIEPLLLDVGALSSRGLTLDAMLDGCKACDARTTLAGHSNILVF